MSYHSNGNSESTGPSSNTPNITNSSSTNDVSNYSQTSNLNNSRAIHILTPDKLRSVVLDFPPNPIKGDTYVKHNTQYTWNGQYWEANNAKLFVDRFGRYDMSVYDYLP